MFWGASSFNQDISLWNVGSVNDMTYMLGGATSFTNHDLSSWDVSNIWFCQAEGFLSGAGSGNIAPNFAECF